jgi:hypothetical protein
VQLSAQASGLYHTWTELLPVGDRRPALEPVAPVLIRMAKTTTVTVTVTDATGKRVAGQTVVLEPKGSPVGKWSGSGTTDAEGQAVIQGVPPGEYLITDRTYPPPQKAGKTIRVEEGREFEAAVSW